MCQSRGVGSREWGHLSYGKERFSGVEMGPELGGGG